MVGTADFETIVRENDCRVWAYGICEIGNINNFSYGNNIEDFFKFCSKKENHTLYFHNLKFDGMFIISYLFENGFNHVVDKKQVKDKTFTTLISDMGQFYQIEVYFKKDKNNTNKVTFLDSLKILNFRVEQIAKDFNLNVRKLKLGLYSPFGPIKKEKIDFFDNSMIKKEDRIYRGFNRLESNKFAIYKKYFSKGYKFNYKKFNRAKRDLIKMQFGYKGFREIGHKLTPEELEYLKNDCIVMAQALEKMFEINLVKMTIGADALHEYKEVISEKSFDRHFPELKQQDEYLRKSYRGGFTYLNPKYRNKIVKSGIVLDVNSLYPSVMYYDSLPYGTPIRYIGKYKKDKVYSLYIQVITCQFELKEGKIPTLQLKKNLAYPPTEYLTSSYSETLGMDREQTLYLTKPDLELFLENYEVYNLEYEYGFKFKASKTLFKKYIDKWMQVKVESKLNGNYAMEKISKLMLNSLYGKFATNPKVRSKNPYFDQEIKKVRFNYGEEEIRKTIYVALASFVTSYARCKTIRAAQSVIHRFIYADTDSLHLEGYELPENLAIHNTNLGEWKHEFTFDTGKYLRQKSYMEYGKDPSKEEEKYTKIVCAGMSSKCYKHVNFNNFRVGATFKGKLQPKIVEHGVFLKDTTFTIKAHAFF